MKKRKHDKIWMAIINSNIKKKDEEKKKLRVKQKDKVIRQKNILLAK